MLDAQRVALAYIVIVLIVIIVIIVMIVIIVIIIVVIVVIVVIALASDVLDAQRVALVINTYMHLNVISYDIF